MALTSTTTFDLVNQTQILTFNNPSQLDQIIFTNNQITFSAISTFNLSKSDLLLYLQFLNIFSVLLSRNFPFVNASIASAWPLCSFDITESNVGVKKIIYTQNTASTNVYTIDYLPLIASCSFAARASPVVITTQEFLSMVDFLTQYAVQVNLN